jgi:hypothetical protein
MVAGGGWLNAAARPVPARRGVRRNNEAELVTQDAQEVARVDDVGVNFEDVPSGQPRVIDHGTIGGDPRVLVAVGAAE